MEFDVWVVCGIGYGIGCDIFDSFLVYFFIFDIRVFVLDECVMIVFDCNDVYIVIFCFWCFDCLWVILFVL